MKLRVVFKKLPKNWFSHTKGMYYGELKTVAIDPRQRQKSMLETAIHEGLHAAFPHLNEHEVRKAEATIAQIPWKLGFRRVKKR